jgi:hypothetical protein
VKFFFGSKVVGVECWAKVGAAAVARAYGERIKWLKNINAGRIFLERNTGFAKLHVELYAGRLAARRSLQARFPPFPLTCSFPSLRLCRPRASAWRSRSLFQI